MSRAHSTFARSARTRLFAVAFAPLMALVLLAPTAIAQASAPSETSTSTVTEDGYLTVSDGIRLRYHLERPAGSSKYPVLLQYDGYSAGTGPDFGSLPKLKARMLAKGYAFLGVSIRGTGCSGGINDLFEPRQAKDGAEAIDWAAHQTWSNGEVGMLGYSYPGVMQLLTAGLRPAALKAIAPSSVVADLYRDVTHPGGVPNTFFQSLFTVQQRVPSLTAVPEAVLAGDAECAANFAANQTRSPIIALQGASNPYIDDPMDYLTRSGITNASKINVPALLVAYWQDEQTGSRLAGAWEPGGLMTALDPQRTWITLGNGNHDYTPENTYQVDLMERFFDYYLGGKQNGWASTPHVSVQHETKVSTGAQSWMTTYPGRPSTTASRFYLQAGGRLATSTQAASSDPDDTFSYPLPSASTNPVPGVTSVSGNDWALAGPDDGRVVYTTPALSKDVTTFGSASADLWLRSTAADTDLQVTITEVRPDGSEVYVQRGWLRASSRRLDSTLSTTTRPLITGRRADAQTLIPGVPTKVRVEISPFGHTFRAGSSVRMIIDAPTGITGNWGFAFNPTPSETTILHSTTFPSSLVLGVIRGETSGGRAAPACGDLLNQPCRQSIGAVPAGLLSVD